MATRKSNKYTQKTESGIKSCREIAKETKELVIGCKEIIYSLNRAPAGLKNTCEWGKNNPNFNKYNIKFY